MSVAERMRRQLAPYAEADPDGLLDGLATGFAAPLDICDVARDTDTHIAWGTVLDPDVADARLLPWLAQFSGDQLLPSDTEQQQRDRLTSPSNFYRGTTEAIKAEIRPTLTGNQIVIVLDFVGGNQFAVTIITRTAETPDPAAVQVAAKRQLAPWLVPTFLVTDDVLWSEATDTWAAVPAGVTWATVELVDVTKETHGDPQVRHP